MTDSVLVKDDLTDEERKERQKAIDRGDFVEGGDDDPLKKPDESAKPAEPEDKEEKKDDEEPAPVPYARFKEVNKTAQEERDARIRLEGENAALRGGKKEADPEAAKQPTVAELRKQAGDALLEGNTDKYGELMNQADETLFNQSRQAAVLEVHATQTQSALNEVAAKMVKDYPFLDSNSAEADKEAIADVIALRDAKMARGMSPAAALEAAVIQVAGKPAAEPAKEGKESKESKEADDIRQRNAIARGAAAARAQPATLTGGKGTRTGQPEGQLTEAQLRSMSDEQFKNIPKDEKARARGDIVE